MHVPQEIYMNRPSFTDNQIAFALVATATTLLPLAAHSQEDSTPQNPKLAELKEKADEEKLLTEIAKARRDRFDASLPASSTKGNEGKIELDKVTVEAHIQAYTALNKAVRDMASAIGQSGAKTIVIRNSNDVKALVALKTVNTHIAFLEDQYKAVFRPGPAPGSALPPGTSALLIPQVLSSVLGSVGDVAALFKPDVTVSGVDVTLGHSAVVPELARWLAGSATVYYPEVAPANLLESRSEKMTAFLESLSRLGGHYNTAKPVVDALVKIRELEAKLAAAKDADKPAIETQLAQAKQNPNAQNPRGAALVALNESVDKLLAGLQETDDAGLSNLAKLGNAIELHTILEKPDSRLLEIAVQKAGGNNKTIRRTFASPKDYYSGGVIISYTLFHPKGMIALSGNASNYEQYQRPFKIKAPGLPR
jgi:hypothetical protein